MPALPPALDTPQHHALLWQRHPARQEAARERTAAKSCHGKAPGNASRENLVTVGRRGNAFRGHFAIGECPGTHQGTILPSPGARKHINEELA